MLIRFIKLVDDAIPFKYSREGDACLDMFAKEDVLIRPYGTALISTGIAVEIPSGFVGIVKGRSGLAYHNNLLVHTGTIDSNYRGDVGVIIFNLSNDSVQIHKNMRIAQFSVHCAIHLDLKEVDELSITNRGTQGYGSSGT